MNIDREVKAMKDIIGTIDISGLPILYRDCIAAKKPERSEEKIT